MDARLGLHTGAIGSQAVPCTRDLFGCVLTLWKTIENTSWLVLVGGIPTPLKNMKVSWDDYSEYIEK